MTVYYLSGLAIPGAFANSGFHEEPYILDRDCEVPPVELQRLIFPWIESQYPENPNWANECNDVMMGLERSGATIADDILAEGGIATDATDSGHSTRPVAHAQMEVAKYSLLHLLLHLRRVILQDAAMFINASRDITTPLTRNPIFLSALFIDFKTTLVVKMGSTPGAIRQFEDIVPDLVQVMELNRKETAQILSQVRRQQELDSLQRHILGSQQRQDYEAIKSQMQCLESRLNNVQSCVDALLQNQERENLNRRRHQIAFAPELVRLHERLTPPPQPPASPFLTNTTATAAPVGTAAIGAIAMEDRFVSARREGVTKMPFKFNRGANTIQDVVLEFERLCPIEKEDKALGYPTNKAYRTEYRYINNRRTIMRELSFLLKTTNCLQKEAMTILQEVMDNLGLKIAVYQQHLRGRQKRRKEEGKVSIDNNNNNSSNGGDSDSDSTHSSQV